MVLCEPLFVSFLFNHLICIWKLATFPLSGVENPVFGAIPRLLVHLYIIVSSFSSLCLSNKCWYNMGSLRPVGSITKNNRITSLKKLFFIFTGFKEPIFSSNLDDSATEFPRALSLLSTNSWVSSEPESISFDQQHLHANPPTSSMSLPVIHSIPQGLAFASSDYWHTQQQNSASPNNLHNNNSSSNSGGQSHEIRPFKPHYQDIYSNALN